MHKYYSKGFTVIELLIIIAVIVVLAGVSTLAYIEIQKQSRDAKRSSDATTLLNELEKFYDEKGDYPPGCPGMLCGGTLYTANTSTSAPITSTMTLDELRSILPELPEKFGDPAYPSRPPMGSGGNAEKRYFYFGGLVNYTTTSYVATVSTPQPVCSIRSNLNANQLSSYVIGFFSEESNKWVLKSGQKGVQMTVVGGLESDGCVINR